MNNEKLSTEAYKGVRDFYPSDWAIQKYIFSVWTKSAESFGFAEYQASILEPALLYKSKGAVNEEMVNDQTYTFIDRGEREVTLRPEMTPTVARLIAAKRRDLTFPVRWFSIPNLFRYERPQRGRLREHWQLNCDIFGSKDVSADVEIIALVDSIFKNFGASEESYTILVNDRQVMESLYRDLGITDQGKQHQITSLNDRKRKITAEQYKEELLLLLDNNQDLVTQVIKTVEDLDARLPVVDVLRELGLKNVKVDRTIARGFDYYTGTVFEVLANDAENPRALLGGGRFDQLTTMFDDENVPAVGFGMGDVTMKDFLITNNLLPQNINLTAPTVHILPIDPKLNLEAEKIAHSLRERDIRVAVDFSEKKIGKKIADAGENGVKYVLVLGEDELRTGEYSLKDLTTSEEIRGNITTIITELISRD